MAAHYSRSVARIHILEREQRVALPLERAFEFYGDARNLEAITPPWLGFRLTTPPPQPMRAGALIGYRLKLHGLTVRWKTRIEAWEPPHRFVDVQLSGPYRLWEHTHTFQGQNDGTIVIRDRVRYSLPFGPLGELAHTLFVRRDLRRIFDFRRDAVAGLLVADGVRG
jgi:ligand-binding SRPBCC domain-containing protein